jgi:hypothetical protein
VREPRGGLHDIKFAGQQGSGECTTQDGRFHE